MSSIALSRPAAPARPSRLAALRRPADHPWLCVLLLVGLCGFLFFYGLTAGELYRTESLRAIIAAEFLRSGNWVVPTLYGEPLFTKPPGMYAAIALLSWPAGGVCEWTARLPSALAATATVFLVYWSFGRQLGRLGGLVAALLLPASFMWLDKATAAEIDMLQAAWVTAALLFFLRVLEAEEEGEQRAAGLVPAGINPAARWWLAALLCVAGGVLTKWTAPAFFYGTAIPLLWWRGRLRLLFRRGHLVSAAAGAGLCFAWAGAAVWQTGWHVFYDTVSREALMRLSPSHHFRPYPWRESLAHPFLILAANLPWAVFALFALRPAFFRLWDERGRRLLQALHCWAWPNIFFWSIIPEHAARHSFPIYPAITGLAAMVWVAWLSGRQPWPFLTPTRSVSEGAPREGPRLRFGLVWRPGPALIALLLAWLVVKITFVQVVIPQRNLNREPRAKAEQIAALVPKGKSLYLFQLKDEGIMFYYGRTVLRLNNPAQLPSSPEPLYCILDDAEWRHWNPHRPARALLHLADEQGAPIVLVEVTG